MALGKLSLPAVFKENASKVVGPKAGRLSVIDRLELRQGCFFQGQMSMEYDCVVSSDT